MVRERLMISELGNRPMRLVSLTSGKEHRASTKGRMYFHSDYLPTSSSLILSLWLPVCMLFHCASFLSVCQAWQQTSFKVRSKHCLRLEIIWRTNTNYTSKIVRRFRIIVPFLPCPIQMTKSGNNRAIIITTIVVKNVYSWMDHSNDCHHWWMTTATIYHRANESDLYIALSIILNRYANGRLIYCELYIRTKLVAKCWEI